MLDYTKHLLIFVVALIFAIGLAMIFDTTSAEVIDHLLSKSPYISLLKQIAYAFVGLIFAYFVYFLGYKKVVASSPILLALFTFFLLLVFVPGIGKEVNGSKRWISLAGISFQPSEFVKYLVPLYFTHVAINVHKGVLSLKSFYLLVGTVAVPMVLIMIEPNNGTSGVVFITILVMCILTRIKLKYWAAPLFCFMIVAGVTAYNLNYVTSRVNVYLNPELDIRGRGHQPYQAKIAAGSGKLMGKGPGNSLQKLSYLPEAQNDYIAAIYAEEFGFLGMIVLITLYMLVAYFGFSVAISTADQVGLCVAASFTFLISFQAFMNLGVVSGLLPSTGLNLPFFSQGGSSLIVNMMAISLISSCLNRRISTCESV